MKNDNYLKIKKIFYIACIISIVVSIWFKVSKAAVPDDYIDLIDEKFQEANNYNDALTYLNWAYNNHVTYVAFEDDSYLFVVTYAFEEFGYGFTSINKSDIDNYTLEDFLTVDIRIGDYSNDYTSWCCPVSHSYSECPNINVGSYAGDECPLMIILLDKEMNSLSVNYYKSYNISNGTDAYCYNYSNGNIIYDNLKRQSSAIGTYNSNNLRICTGRQILFNISLFGSSTYTHTFNNIYTCGKVALPFSSGNHGSLSNLYHVLYIDKPYEFINNSTPGLKVFKSGTHGLNYLYVDYSELIAVGSHTSSESSLFITLNIDDIEYEYDFDSEDTYYHWDISTGKVYYQIPFSAIGLGDVSNVNTAYVSNVQVSAAVYTQGGTEDNYNFYYIDELYLIGSPPTNEEYNDPSVIADPNRDIGFSDSQVQEITQILNNASTTNNFDSDKNLTGGSTTPINHSSFDTNSIYTITLYQPFFDVNSPTEEGRYYLYFDRTAGTWASMYTEHYSPFEFISDNKWSQYYDVVEIEVKVHLWEDDQPVVTTGASYSHVTYYYYFYSSRYLLRQMCQRELDIMTYIKLGNQISKDIWELENTRLTEIDTTLVDFAKNFIPYKNSIIDFLSDINNGINSLDIDIIGILRRILDALSNLHLTQLDSIESKLNTIVENISTNVETINEDDTIAEAIAYYNTHSQAEAVLEDKYSVWFTGYCHFWLQEYQEIPTRSSNNFYSDHVSEERRNIILNTYHVITTLYDNMQQDLMFNRVTEMFDYFLGLNTDNVSHTRQSYFSDIFDEEMTPTLDYNPYE